MRHVLFYFDVLQSFLYIYIADGMLKIKKPENPNNQWFEIKENEGMQFEIWNLNNNISMKHKCRKISTSIISMI